MNAMPPARFPPAFCPSCKLLFEAVGTVVMDEGSRVKLSKIRTNCPRCKKAEAELLDGDYRVVSGVLNVLMSQSVSVEIRLAIAKLIAGVQENKISLDEAKREADRIAPGFGKLFAISGWSDAARATLFASIIGLIGATFAGCITGAATVLAPHLAAPTTLVLRLPEASDGSPRIKDRLLSGSANSRLPFERTEITPPSKAKAKGRTPPGRHPR